MKTTIKATTKAIRTTKAMKIKMLTLVASALIMSATNAQSLTPNQIFSAIDGEYNHVTDDTRRVNFDMSELDAMPRSNANLDNVLSGIDGEYSHGNESRINYSLDSSDSNDVWTVNSVLSGVDGEYN